MGKPRKTSSDRKMDAVREVFAAWGSQGGKARAKALTKEQRSAIARKGARALWGKRSGR